MATILWIIGGLVVTFIVSVLIMAWIIDDNQRDGIFSRAEVDDTDYTNEDEDNYRL